VLSGHGDAVMSAAYAPDSARIVTASEDKTVRIWDARTGVQLAVLFGHRDSVNAAAYSPDGSRIVTSSDDKTARIWDAPTGVELMVIAGHGEAVSDAVYSPDGTRIATASHDKTARIWDARIPGSLEAQIVWEAAAEANLLSPDDRAQLGLPADPRVKTWGSEVSACDQAAAAYYDPDRLTQGLPQEAIVADVAGPACSLKNAETGTAPRLAYQAARALLAKSDVKLAKQQFEIAVSGGYRAAAIDLARLLIDPSAGMLDPARAVSLYEKAWRDGVPIAAFELGHLFEFGVAPDAESGRRPFKPDMTNAWAWYRMGAELGEPNAVARLAKFHDDNAIGEPDLAKRSAFLLQAFRLYATAAARAHDADWPDGAWNHWRYRRATLARFLAREGMMQQVAETYAAVLGDRG